MLGKQNQRGQAIVEVALIAPFVLLLLLGSYDLSVLASNKVVTVSAVRHGVRLAAQLGGVTASSSCKGQIDTASFNPSDTTPAGDGDGDGALDAIDLQVAQSVTTALANANYLTIDEIDIYQPKNADGKLHAGDLVDYYKLDNAGKPVEKSTGSPLADTQTFVLNKRCQSPVGQESEIGVQVIWHYVPVNHFPANSVSFTDWAVEKMALCDSVCK